MTLINIQEKDNQAIEKAELDEFEAKRLRGTGYDMMKVRDKGWGVLHDYATDGRTVSIEWHVDGVEEKAPEGVAYRRIPEGKFIIRVGKEEALVDKEAFRRLFRWA